MAEAAADTLQIQRKDMAEMAERTAEVEEGLNLPMQDLVVNTEGMADLLLPPQKVERK